MRTIISRIKRAINDLLDTPQENTFDTHAYHMRSYS
jgi:hypothetical protein